MLRVILDEHGAFSNDLFVKIDGSPSQVFVASTTWLPAFFDGGNDHQDVSKWDEGSIIRERKAYVVSLLKSWKQALLSDQPTCYLLFDLADQSSSALQVIKKKKLFHISTASTCDIIDGSTEAFFVNNQAAIRWQIDNSQDWRLAPASILIGLDWSIARLHLPVVPLRYS